MNTKREDESKVSAEAGHTGTAPAPSAAGAAHERAEESAHADKSKGHKKEKARIEELTRAREEAEQAKAGIQDRLIRLQADFDNFRKRTLREKSELFRTANEELLTELIPVIDHFDLALDAGAGNGSAVASPSSAKATDQDALFQGVRMVRDQLMAVLAKFGLQPMDPAKTFDPALQEAISHLPSERIPEGGIIAQTRRGYLLGDKLLRPAQVVVSSGGGEGPVPADDTAAADAGVDAGE